MPKLRQKPYPLATLPADVAARLQSLDAIDTFVPPRHEKRTHDHAEIYCIVEALKYDHPLPLTFPAEVLHNDRPDILIKTPSETIGVEIMEAVSPTTASLDALRARTPGAPDITWARNEVPGAPQLPAKTQKKIIENEIRLHQDESTRHLLGGDGFAGDGAVQWANAMAHFVSLKMGLSQKDGFGRYNQNWVLLYDNWEEPARNVPRADDQLQEVLQEIGAFAIFDLVLILDEQSLAGFSRAGHWRNRASQ
ncbi:TPA: hypothetical protein ACP32N_006539 [Pseudomonas aeruginosa]